jgi:hypothetical protein
MRRTIGRLIGIAITTLPSAALSDGGRPRGALES